MDIRTRMNETGAKVKEDLKKAGRDMKEVAKDIVGDVVDIALIRKGKAIACVEGFFAGSFGLVAATSPDLIGKIWFGVGSVALGGLAIKDFKDALKKSKRE
jgi:hypothetical protein